MFAIGPKSVMEDAAIPPALVVLVPFDVLKAIVLETIEHDSRVFNLRPPTPSKIDNERFPEIVLLLIHIVG